MRRKLLRILALFSMAVCLSAGGFILTCYASTLGVIGSSDSKDGAWYRNTFQGTDWYFQSTVPSGGKSVGEVILRLPAGYGLTEVWTAGKAERSPAEGSTEYRFQEAGTYALKIETPAEGKKALYGSFRFQILPTGDNPGSTPRMETSGTETVYKAVSLGANGNYLSNVTDGAVMTEPAVFRLSPTVSGTVTYGGETVPYVSGTELSEPGGYEMRLTATDALGDTTESAVRFSVGEINGKEPLIPVYTPLVSEEQSVNPNLFYNGTLLTGSWTAEAAFKNDAAMGDGFFQDPEDVSGAEGEDGSGGEPGKNGGFTETGVKVLETAKVRPMEIKQISSSPKAGEGDEDAERGPGVTEAEEPEASLEKIQVELSERYHEEYGMYELSFANRYFFYSNIGDGGITSRKTPVIFDVPANITVEARKDGVEIPYNNKAPISEPGTYVMELSVTDKPELPAGEQTVYQAVYHFRIEEKEPETSQAPDGDEQWGYEGLPAYSSQTGRAGETPQASGSGNQTETAAKPSAEQAAAAEEETAGESGEITGASGEDGEQEGGELTGAADDEDSGKPGETSSDEPVSLQNGSGLEESYDSARDLYAETLISGSVFYSNVPNGMITAVPVTLEIPESMTVRMTRDDKEYELEPGEALTDDGIYRMEIDENRVDYVTGYQTAPFFTFRIAADPVRDMKIYNAPGGYTIVGASRNGEPVETEAGQEACILDEDGQYQFVLLSGDGIRTLTAAVTLDQEPPRFELQGVKEGENTGSEIHIVYLSDDTDRAVLYRNGEETTDFDGSTVTKSGTYVLEVYDKAGNRTSASFQVKYKMNLAAVMAVLLVAALAVTTVLYVKKVKKNVNVR